MPPIGEMFGKRMDRASTINGFGIEAVSPPITSIDRTFTADPWLAFLAYSATMKGLIVTDNLLQIWGGLFYLLNKICFSRSERESDVVNKKRWRIKSWIVYLAGLPAWVIVFVSERNWIAATVETGGAPAMTFGLIVATRGDGLESAWLNVLAKLCVFAGLGLSLYEYGGITNVSQLLELGIASGFLVGTYLMAHNSRHGYLWLILGNMSCAALMGLEGYYILAGQQLFSLVFVTDAYVIRSKSNLVDRISDGHSLSRRNTMFKDFFSRQARKPSGLFGRFVSTLIFDKGNAVVNELMTGLVNVRQGQTILEIGFGTGKVIKNMADRIGSGVVYGIDFSDAMMDVARGRNKRHIENGCVRLAHGQFETAALEAESFDTICSANTIYFWEDQAGNCARIHSLLKPGGKVVLAFMDKAKMETLPLNMDVFDPVSATEVETMLIQAGFASVTTHESAKDRFQHCVVGVK